jgi:hypothetical protein
MEAIFSSAYCVLAATAAEGTHSGFLHTPPPTRSVTLSTPSGDPLYLFATVDDVGGDVEDAGLGSRGWVLQKGASVYCFLQVVLVLVLVVLIFVVLACPCFCP